jgi:NodT family efflux transporter outer membrane factor (OMF) lipoprotein
MRLKAGGLLLLMAGTLAGCTTLGPQFEPPLTSWDAEWKSEALDQLPKSDVVADGRWWTQFNDPALDALITLAVRNNNNLKIAGLRVIEARAQLGIARSALFPQQVVASVGSGYGASASDGRPIGGSDFAFVTGALSTGWEIDFWGRFKRGVESADSGYFGSIANYDDFAILLRAEVAQLYVNYRLTEARLKVAQSNVEVQRRTYQITKLLFDKGANDELDLQQARTQLSATEGTIPGIEASLRQIRNALSVLTGQPPGTLAELDQQYAEIPVAARTVAVEIPADFLRQRPDVRSAAYAAAAQSARIGIAMADLYPSFSLFGNVGLTGTDLGSVTNVIDINVGPSLRWNVLDFGRIKGNVRVQDARFEQAMLAYQEAVLQAAADVDNNAVAFESALRETQILETSAKAAARSTQLAQLRYREGLSDFQRVLDAQAALLRQQDRLIVSQAQASTSLIALYKSLGGGWISAQESDFADDAMRERMKARINWGGLIDTAPTQGKPTK